MWYKFNIINVVILVGRSKTGKRRGICMKYQDNIRNHYFWDSSEMPNIHETKMMIREYWRTAKEDEAYRKARNKADIISGLAIFGGIGCLFAMIYMIIAKIRPQTELLYGVVVLISEIVFKLG